MSDFLRYPYTRPGGRSRSWPSSDFLSTDLPAERSPDWQLLVSPSYKNVDTNITLESTSVAASELLYADAATATAWTPTTGSGSLSATAATVATYGPFVDEIIELSSDRFIEAGSTFGDIAAEDFVIEMTGRAPHDGTNRTYVSKLTGGVGWKIDFSSGVPTFSMDDNTTEATDADASSTLAAGEWFHIMVICDRSSATGLRIYVNGTQSATPGDCSSIGSITNAGSLTLGNASGDFGIGHLAIWKQASWLNGSDYASVVTQRFQQVQGWYNASSTVTATQGDSHAYGDAYDSTTGERRIFRVGDNWVPCRITADGAYTWAQDAMRLYHVADPTDLADAAWGPNDLSISADAIASPFTGDTADGMVVSATPSGSAQISDTLGTAGGVSNIVSFWAKRGSSDYVWVAFYSSPGFVTNHAIIRLTDGVVTRTDATRSWRVESWGNGWYRCIGTPLATTPSSSILLIGPCDSPTSYSSVSGDAAAVNIYVYGINVHRATFGAAKVPNDPPYVSIALSDRSADVLEFDVSSADPLGDGIGSVWFEYKRPDTVTQTDVPLLIQDASATGRNITFTQQTDGTLDCSIADGVGTSGSLSTTTAVNDGTERDIRLRHSTDDGAGLKVAGTEEDTDTYTAEPADLDEVVVRRYVSNIRLFQNRQY